MKKMLTFCQHIVNIMLTLIVCGACAKPAVPVGDCLEPTMQKGEVLARVGSVALTVDEMRERVKAQGDMTDARFSRAKDLRAFVEDQIRFELLARAAMERGLYRDPEVVDAARRVMVRKLLQKELGVTNVEEVTGDEDLQAREKHLNTQRTLKFQVYLEGLRGRYPVSVDNERFEELRKSLEK